MTMTPANNDFLLTVSTRGVIDFPLCRGKCKCNRLNMLQLVVLCIASVSIWEQLHTIKSQTRLIQQMQQNMDSNSTQSIPIQEMQQKMNSGHSLVVQGDGDEEAVTAFPETVGTTPTAFTIRSNRTFSWYRGGSELELFHSFVPFNNGFQVVFNYKIKDPESEGSNSSNGVIPGSQYIETMHLSPSFERNETSRRRLGEKGYSDPRVFIWNQSAYCLTWKINWRGNRRGSSKFDGLDFDNFMINLITGEQYRLNHCVGGYRGKNWIPLVYQEKLYIVHRMSPKMKWFEYSANGGCAAPTVTETETKDIDEWRGGSAFIPYSSNLMISVGHKTVDGDTHIPFLMHVDMNTNRSSITELSTNEKAWEGILDPTSLWWGDDGKLFMGTIHTAGRWKHKYFKDEYIFNNSVYEVQLGQSEPSYASTVSW